MLHPECADVFGRGSVLGISTPLIIMAVLYLLAWVPLECTPFERHVYAIGGNEQATRLSGIKVLVSVLAGLTTAIAAVVLGGTAISGGRGSIIGTLIGATLLGILNNGLNRMNIEPYPQLMIKGAIILAATYIGYERRA